MSDFTKKYKTIIFYHTFRLVHNDKDDPDNATRKVLYETSCRYRADGDNLQYQLQNSLDRLVKQLKYLGYYGWYGVHFINIMMENNDTIVKVEYDDRREIKKTHKKTNKQTAEYMFIDDTEKTNPFETKIKKIKKKETLTNHQLRKII